jgi:YXWGXW repeat-containing protein
MHKVSIFLCSALAILAILAVPVSSDAQVAVGISVRIGPPALPVYTQPICPGPGYVWIPGYWAYDDDDGYYWVPGTWVVAPVGMLWTPGYWGWGGGVYAWHPGYWGPHVGFYGGINYGFGYTGVGYYGGYWRGRDFYYNRAVNNVNITRIHNTYNTTIINNTTVNRVSYNGGHGGINARPTAFEERASHERHFEATTEQMEHQHAARSNPGQLASANHGHPAFAATPKGGEFKDHGPDFARATPSRGASSSSFGADHRHLDDPNFAHNNSHVAPSQKDYQSSRQHGNPQTRYENTPRSSEGGPDHGKSAGEHRGEGGGSHGPERGGERHEGPNGAH